MFRVDNVVIDFTLGFDKGFEKEVEFLKRFFRSHDSICLFPIVAWGDYEMSPIAKRYISERLYTINNDIVFEIPEDVKEDMEHCKIYWVKPENDAEIQELIEEDPYTYGFCIIKDGEYTIRNYETLIEIEENFMFKGEEYRALIITEGKI